MQARFSVVTELQILEIQDLFALQHKKSGDVVPLFCLFCIPTPCFSAPLTAENRTCVHLTYLLGMTPGITF
jgi:hypothetical protein